MSKIHDKWYTRLFSDPKIVEELLRSFVHEDFIEKLDFTSLKKLNTKFIQISDEYRHADVIYEIKSKGQTAFIYLFLEFQSTVDRFMPMRLGRYLFEFYEEIQGLTKSEYLNPPFPILIYSGNEKWTAPTRFSELFYPSDVPEEYIPEFRYFKIAINEIPKRKLVRIRNAVATIFYVENSAPEDIAKNRKELVAMLKEVFYNEGVKIVRAIVNRINKTQKMPRQSATIKSIEDLMEVSSMWETNVKNYYKRVEEKAIEKGIEKGKKEAAMNLIEKGMDNAFIRDITGLSVKTIQSIRKGKS